MAGEKVDVTYTVNTDMAEMLEEAAKKHDLADASKALRVILDNVIHDGDHDEIFNKIRCHRCAGGPLGRFY